MNNIIEVNNADNFVEHPGNPGAIINVNDKERQAYRQARNLRLDNQKKIDEINTMKEDLNNLKSDMNDIKLLLKEILERK